MSAFNKTLYYFYELAILLALCVLIITPFHLAANRHYNIDRVLSPTSVAFKAQDTSFISPGDIYPIYRFNPDWTSEIGYVNVTSVNDHEVTVSYDPKAFRWPMGRQSRVVVVDDSTLNVLMGSDLGLKTGDMLCLFNGRDLVGKVRLQEVHPDHSLAKILSINPGLDRGSLTASEFIFATQVSFFKDPVLAGLEMFLFVFVFLAHSYCFIIRQRPIFLSWGDGIRRLYQRLPKKTFHFTANIILGLPFIWFMVNFLPRCLVYLLNNLIKLTGFIFHSPLSLLDINPWFNENIVTLYVVGTAVYLWVLIATTASPILLFWRWAEYKRRDKKIVDGFWRDLIVWSLHLVIFYAFGRTLWGFLTANMNASFNLIWPGQNISMNDLSRLSHAPMIAMLSFYDTLMVIRYWLWSLTIIGCLFGYGYSVFGYLYGKKIRGLDFTPMGWVTNAVCYGPLLGAIIFQMTPPLLGMDPVLSQGPLKYIVLISELILNLVYTLTIWNLGALFGVMTDKGVRTSGFYSIVRHPSYTVEALMFVMVFFNGLSAAPQWLTISMFLLTYYVRSEREDQFMSVSNPEYKVYQQKTPYKFIPGIY